MQRVAGTGEAIAIVKIGDCSPNGSSTCHSKTAALSVSTAEKKDHAPLSRLDEDRFSSNGIPIEYEPIGTAGPSRQPVASKGADLYGDEDGTYDEKVGEEEIPASQETVAERPVEDNVKDQIKPAENKGKAVDRAWTSLLLMG